MGTNRAAGPTPPPVRCECGRRPGGDDRFCAACGRPVDRDGSGEQPGLALLIDDRRSRGVGPTTTEVQTRFPTGPVLVTGAALLVLLLAWSLFQGPRGEIVPEGPDDELDGEGGGADSAEEAVPTTTIRPSTTQAGDVGGNPATTSTGAVAASGPGEGPLLGEVSGLTLVTGRAGAGPIQLLDLDTGRLRELERHRGAPLGTIGSSLVLRQNAAIRIADLSDPGSDAVELSGPELPGGFWADFAGIGDDRVWVYQQDADASEVRLVGYDTEGVVRVTYDPADGLGWFRWGFNGDVVYHPAGGVYQREGDAFVRRSGGLLVAVGDELVLVHECDAAMRCRSRWLDSSTWDDVDHPVPPFNPESQSSIVGADRWLYEFDWQEGTTRLYDIAGGVEVRENALGNVDYGLPTWSPPLSDDGRWLVDRATTTGDGLVVVDLDSGREWPIPIELSGEWGVVFVESSLLGSSGS